MALSSQSAHNTSGRRYMSSRRRRRKRWPAFILLILVGVLVWFMWPKDGKTPGDDALVVDGEANHSAAVAEQSTRLPAERRQPMVVKPVSPPPPPPSVDRDVASDEQQVVAPVVGDIVEPSPPVAEPAGVTGGLTDQAAGMIKAGQLVEARQLLSDAIFAGDDSISPSELAAARQMVGQINQSLVFSKRIVPGDPLVTTYVIERGDALSRIAPTYKTPYQLISLVNGISNPNRIRLGQRLKVIKGPLHAIIDKSEFRMDVFVVAPDGRRVLIRSFPVGLGENDSTPLGKWVVRTGSKLENPRWTDPVTGKTFASGAVDNPIGKYWVGIMGADENTKDMTGYGLHGTIDPDSVGQMASMGCVRMHAADIELVYKMLIEKYSTVEIRP